MEWCTNGPRAYVRVSDDLSLDLKTLGYEKRYLQCGIGGRVCVSFWRQMAIPELWILDAEQKLHGPLWGLEDTRTELRYLRDEVYHGEFNYRVVKVINGSIVKFTGK